MDTVKEDVVDNSRLLVQNTLLVDVELEEGMRLE